MNYLIDIHSTPPCVVLTHEDAGHVAELGQRYSDQVGRPLVVATGPHPADCQVRPTVPDAPVVVPPGVAGVNLAPQAPSGAASLWDVFKSIEHKLEPAVVEVLMRLLTSLAK